MSLAGNEDEAELVNRTQNGDSAAFQILLRRYLPMINSYAARMLGNQADAADIAQEVFIRFWQKSSSFDARKAKLGTWLHQIARNLCIDHFRQQRNLETGVTDNMLETEAATDSDQYQITTESSSAIKQALAALPERQRSALLFCHYQGLSNKQAAEILEVSIDALESLLSRARRGLRGHLHHQLEELKHG
ncbi:MAG: sigma-70 family RNA polymerase sigma factor [Pseudomonadales bacterium]